MSNRSPGMGLATAALIVLLLSLPARLVTAEEPDRLPAAIGSVYSTPVDAMPPLLGEVYVQAIRQKLADHGYRPGSDDGALLVGRMPAAIKAYQRDAGLPIDGIATRELLDHLMFALPKVYATQPRPKGDTGPKRLRADHAVVAPKIVRVRIPARKPSFDAAPGQSGTSVDLAEVAPATVPVRIPARKPSFDAAPEQSGTNTELAEVAPATVRVRIPARKPSFDTASRQSRVVDKVEHAVSDSDPGSLEGQLVRLRGSQKSLVDRLSKRAVSAIRSLERTLAMTGLDTGALLPKAELDPPGPAQGGPFIPSGPGVRGDPVRSLQHSINLLNLQVDRLTGLEEVVASLPLTAPLDQFRISSGFGPRKDPITGAKSLHHGIDFAARRNTPVLSTAPGKITYAARKNRYGRLVEIDHGFGVRTRYAHLQKILVKVGQRVGYREKIGLLGSSGRSTGPHVHYEVLVNGKPFDPINFLRAGHGMFRMIRG